MRSASSCPAPTSSTCRSCLGRAMRGPAGAAAALVGLLGRRSDHGRCSACSMRYFGDIAALQRMLAGVAAAAAGLIIATVAKMAVPMFERSGATWRRWCARDVRRHRPAALADAVGAARAGADQHRAGLVGAAMKDDGDTLLTLAGYFAIMSLFAHRRRQRRGAGNASRQAVELRGMDDRPRSSPTCSPSRRSRPGRTSCIVTLIGYHVAGFAGGAGHHLGDVWSDLRVCLFVGRIWDRFKDAPWRMVDPGGIGADFDRPGRRERLLFVTRRCVTAWAPSPSPSSRARNLH